MKQFVYGALVATAVLGAAGFAVMKESTAEAGFKRMTPLRLDDITLDRAFRYQFAVGTWNTPTAIPFPATLGFVVTTIKDPFANGEIYEIAVGAFPSERIHTFQGGAGDDEKRFDPPIIIRPGQTMTVGRDPTGASTEVILGGYWVNPGEV